MPGDLKRFDRLALAPHGFDARDQHSAHHDQCHRSNLGLEQTSQALVAAKKARQVSLCATRHRIRLPGDCNGGLQNRIAREVNPVIVGGRQVDGRIPTVAERLGYLFVTKQRAKRVVDALGLDELIVADVAKFVQAAIRRRDKCTPICRLRSRARPQFARKKIFERSIIIGRRTGCICQGHIEGAYPQSDQQMTYPRRSERASLPNVRASQGCGSSRWSATIGSRIEGRYSIKVLLMGSDTQMIQDKAQAAGNGPFSRAVTPSINHARTLPFPARRASLSSFAVRYSSRLHACTAGFAHGGGWRARLAGAAFRALSKSGFSRMIRPSQPTTSSPRASPPMRWCCSHSRAMYLTKKLF